MALSLIVFGIMMVIRETAGDGGYLAWQMARHAPAEQTGLPAAEYPGMGEMIADYLRGRRTEFQYTYTDAEGLARVCFKAHEQAHMADCRALIRTAEGLALGTGFLAALLLALMILGMRDEMAWVCRGMIIGLRIAAGAAAVIGLWALVNFEGLFVTFHRIAFPNGGWRLNPGTDMLIRLMPQRFFEDLGKRGAAIALAVPAVIWGTARWGIWKITGSWKWDEI